MDTQTGTKVALNVGGTIGIAGVLYYALQTFNAMSGYERYAAIGGAIVICLGIGYFIAFGKKKFGVDPVDVAAQVKAIIAVFTSGNSSTPQVATSAAVISQEAGKQVTPVVIEYDVKTTNFGVFKRDINSDPVGAWFATLDYTAAGGKANVKTVFIDEDLWKKNGGKQQKGTIPAGDDNYVIITKYGHEDDGYYQKATNTAFTGTVDDMFADEHPVTKTDILNEIPKEADPIAYIIAQAVKAGANETDIKVHLVLSDGAINAMKSQVLKDATTGAMYTAYEHFVNSTGTDGLAAAWTTYKAGLSKDAQVAKANDLWKQYI